VLPKCVVGNPCRSGLVCVCGGRDKLDAGDALRRDFVFLSNWSFQPAACSDFTVSEHEHGH